MSDRIVEVDEFVGDRRGRFNNHCRECCVPPLGLKLGQVARGHLRSLAGNLEQAIAMNGTLNLVGESNSA